MSANETAAISIRERPHRWFDLGAILITRAGYTIRCVRGKLAEGRGPLAAHYGR